MRHGAIRCVLAALSAAAALSAGAAVRIAQDQCGPFTDVTPQFCPYVLEMYYLGITAGTSATTYSPNNPVTRGQAAVFVSKGINQALARSSKRAALGQWWLTAPHWDAGLGIAPGLDEAQGCTCDGADVWAADSGQNTVVRFRASDGKIVDSWTVATRPFQVLSAMGRIFIADVEPGVPGSLYMIDPAQPSGDATLVAGNLGAQPQRIVFDGARLWTVNADGGAATSSLSIVTPDSGTPWPVTTVTQGFSFLEDIVWDGSSIWVTDGGAGSLLRLDANGAIVQTVPASNPGRMVFDGTNIWVLQFHGKRTPSDILVVRAITGEIVATLSGNGPTIAQRGAFDGRRIMIGNTDPPNVSPISLWDAASLQPLGTFSSGLNNSFEPGPNGICSDGVSFFLTFPGRGLARY
jgi:hypothetical protein